MRVRIGFACVMGVLSACARTQAPQLITPPAGAHHVQLLKGEPFEAGMAFLVEVAPNSYEPLNLVEAQLRNRRYSECEKGDKFSWGSDHPPEEMIVRYYLNRSEREFAVVRIIQTGSVNAPATQQFRVVMQKYSDGSKNDKTISEFCGHT